MLYSHLLFESIYGQKRRHKGVGGKKTQPETPAQKSKVDKETVRLLRSACLRCFPHFKSGKCQRSIAIISPSDQMQAVCSIDLSCWQDAWVYTHAGIAYQEFPPLKRHTDTHRDHNNTTTVSTHSSEYRKCRLPTLSMQFAGLSQGRTNNRRAFIFSGGMALLLGFLLPTFSLSADGAQNFKLLCQPSLF